MVPNRTYAPNTDGFGLLLRGHCPPVYSAPRLVGIMLSTGPPDLIVQPFGDVQINLAVQAVPELVEEKQSAIGLAFDLEESVVGVLVAGGAQAYEVPGLGFSAFGEAFQVVNVEPNSIWAPRGATAPAVPAQDLS